MLHSFLTTNRAQLIERCRAEAATRVQPNHYSNYGIPFFLDQLIETLMMEQSADSDGSRAVPGCAGGGPASEVAAIAKLHGRKSTKNGFTLEQVVRDYRDVCRAVTNLALETQAPIAVNEFRTLNRCIDNAIAGAVTEFSCQQIPNAPEERATALNSRFGPLAHELRNYLHVAMYAVKAIKAGNVGFSGATGTVLERSLIGMLNLIDSSLAEVRIATVPPPRAESIQLIDILQEVEAAAVFDSSGCATPLTIALVDPDIIVLADPEMLISAVGSLLQNASDAIPVRA